MASKNNQEFSNFWTEDIIPHIEECGYSIGQSTAIYAVASTGEERYGIELIEETTTTLGSGLSVDETVELLASQLKRLPQKTLVTVLKPGQFCT
jgi:hypothetical protein